MPAVTFRNALPLLAACCLLAVAQTRAAETPQRPLGRGDPVPPVEAITPDGGVLRLADYRGEVLLLDFWASWCAPCLESMPKYDRLHAELQDQGFRVIGIGIDRDREAAMRVLERTGVRFPIAFDPMHHWSRQFGLIGMPSAYLIDREGVIQFVYIGFSSEYFPRLEARVRAMVEAPSKPRRDLREPGL